MAKKNKETKGGKGIPFKMNWVKFLVGLVIWVPFLMILIAAWDGTNGPMYRTAREGWGPLIAMIVGSSLIAPVWWLLGTVGLMMKGQWMLLLTMAATVAGYLWWVFKKPAAEPVKK